MIAADRLAEETLLAGDDQRQHLRDDEYGAQCQQRLLDAVDRAATAYRNRQRLADDEILTFVAPAWLRSLVRADITRQAYVAPGEFSITNAMVTPPSPRNVSPAWALDWPNADWDAQQDGMLDGWPDTCPSLLFAVDSFLRRRAELRSV